MTYLVAFIVCFIAGIGAGLGTGFAGMSAAAVISPMLITFLGMDPYMAVGIALASDVLASAISAYTYGKSGNLDIKNGAVMMASVLCFTLVGSYVASLVPGTTMGGFSTFMTLLLGVKFIVRPVMTTKSAMNAVSVQKRFAQSLLCGAGVGFICGFIGAGGGMVMLLLGRVPREGDSVDWADWKFEVVDMDGRRIDKVLAIPLSGAKKTEEPEGSSAS